MGGGRTIIMKYTLYEFLGKTFLWCLLLCCGSFSILGSGCFSSCGPEGDLEADGGDPLPSGGDGDADAGVSTKDGGTPHGDGGELETLDGGVVGSADGGVTICDISEAIFDSQCIGCHDGAYQFDLRSPGYEDTLVNVTSTVFSSETRVVPYDVEASFLYQKMAGTHSAENGDPMPPPGGSSEDDLEYVRSWIESGASLECDDGDADGTPVLLDDADYLLRLAMALKGTRPSASEYQRAAENPDEIENMIEEYLETPQFGETVREIFNEALLVKTQKGIFIPVHGALETLANERGEPFTSVELTDRVTRTALRTIEYIVMTDRPFTEVLTADYLVADEVVQTIWGDGSESPGRNNVTLTPGMAFQSEENVYADSDAEPFRLYTYTDERGPAGVLSSNIFMFRYPSAGGNYHRGRANAATRAMICFDFLSQPVSLEDASEINLADPVEVSAAVSDPEQSCWACHAHLDPIASYYGGFRNLINNPGLGSEGYPFWTYNRFAAYPLLLPITGRQPAYFSEEPELNAMAVDHNNDGAVDIGDLGSQMAADPRFADCAAKRVYSFLLQVELSDVPADMVDQLSDTLESNSFNFKTMVKQMVLSDDFRTSHMATEAGSEENRTLLKIRPSQMARMAEALIDFQWQTYIEYQAGPGAPGVPKSEYGLTDLLRNDYAGFGVLAGGIDSNSVIIPSHSFNASSAAVLASFAAELGGYIVNHDLADGPVDRTILRQVTASDLQESLIRSQLVDVHEELLGEFVETDSEEVDETYALFQASLANGGADTSSQVRHAWKVVLAALLQSTRVAFH